MAEPYDRKAQLVAELEQSRQKMVRDFGQLRGDLNVSAHLRAAFFRQKAVWITGAVLGGWLLTKLPGRKRKATAAVAAPAAGKESRGMLWAILGVVATLLKPAVTSFITDRLTEYLAKRQDAAFPREPSRPVRNASGGWR